MKTLKKTMAALLALTGLVSGSAAAATVTSVGTEITVNGFGAPATWSNPGVSKTYDIGDTERYGTAGYHDILLHFGAGEVLHELQNVNNSGCLCNHEPA